MDKVAKEACKKGCNMPISAFYISTEGDMEEIERFTRVWTAEGASMVDQVDDKLKFYDFEQYAPEHPDTIVEVILSLIPYKTIKLKGVDFK